MAVMAVTAVVAGTGIPAPATWTTDPMWSWGARLVPVVLIWFAAGPLWTMVAPPREPARG